MQTQQKWVDPKYVYIVLLSFSLILSGCTKSDDSKESKNTSITFNIPAMGDSGNQKLSQNVSSFTTADSIVRVMLNITGPNMPPIVWICDSQDQLGQCPQNGGMINISAPRGPDMRLVQLLVVTEGSSGMQFYYGEISKAFDTDVVDLPIVANKLNTATNVQGTIAGRYFDAANTNPTAEVDIYYSPAGGTPMIVERSYMYQGWFEFFFMPDSGFGYRFKNGAKIDSLNALAAAAAMDTTGLGTNIVKINVPQYYRCMSTSVCDSRKNPRRVLIMGYFGPGSAASGKKICTNDSNVSASLPGMKLYNLWDEASPPATGAITTWTGSVSAAGTEFGKIGGGGAGCVSSDLANEIDMDVVKAFEGGGTKILGYEGFFASTGSPMTVNQTGADVYLTATIRTGISLTATPTNDNELNFDLFYKKDAGFVGDHGRTDCDKLELPYGYTKVSSTTAGPSFNHVISNAVKDAIDIRLCPFVMVGGTKKYFRDHSVSNSAYDPTPILAANTPGPGTYTVPSTCSKLKVHIWGAGGGAGNSGAAGGGGAHVEGEVYSVAPGTTVKYFVGLGGTGGVNGGTTGGATGGQGSGICLVKTGAHDCDTSFAIAGGGAGGGGYVSTAHGASGGGINTNGAIGTNGAGTGGFGGDISGPGGGGGSPFSGGVSGLSGSSHAMTTTSLVLATGGAGGAGASSKGSGGGGGGGYSGGGGGGGSGGTLGGGGGGGGTSKFAAIFSSQNGSSSGSSAAGNLSSPWRSGAGDGATAPGAMGANGRVVILCGQ